MALSIALDTNRYTDAARGDAKALDVIARAEHIILPFVVLAELRAGFACGARALENERNLARFRQSPRVEVLYADEQTTHHYANLFRFLRARGTPIPTNDLWVAALVVQHGLVLFARDQHFDSLPQLPRF